MKFIQQSGPHWLGANTVTVMMRRVLLALLPVSLVSVWLFGPGVVLNLAVAVAACAGFEMLALRLRGLPVAATLSDYSILVTAALLALSLPPLLPWWVTVTACFFATVVAKHLYGGLGYNLFNPAMVGYLVALIAFPQFVADWPGLSADHSWPEAAAALSYFATGALPASFDALSGATPLDTLKEQLGNMRTMAEIRAGEGFGLLAGYGWEWLNLASLAGGLWLLRLRVISWHAPGALLATLGSLYFIGYALDSGANPSPVLGLLSGGTMFAAFFIVTDPVSGAASPAGRIVFGAGVGALTFALRKWGAYPDGLAFAVVLMNMCAPLIDRYTVPRVYGHRQRP
ncbi:MAG: RnfABCDGE type electron transport complex subunit D [Gammaproteobacteria bacterium]|jgi:electron transport complex protein RnfD|nr:RnfABCDGE type electron transport complex subunit D [Gammaproteobacteria bacterium]